MTPSELGQVRSVAPVLLAALSQGLTLGWTSPAIGKLRAGQGPFAPSVAEISWVVSFFSLGILVGSMVSVEGRRRRSRNQSSHVADSPRHAQEE